MVDVQRAICPHVIDDLDSFDVARPEHRPLHARGDEERTGIDQINRQRRDETPRQPIVSPGALLGEEREVADANVPVGGRRRSIVKDVGERACAGHRGADAYRLPLDRSLLDCSMAAQPRGDWNRGQMAAIHRRKR
jgi:hypothetical protein